jgi:hypothetical protein
VIRSVFYQTGMKKIIFTFLFLSFAIFGLSAFLVYFVYYSEPPSAKTLQEDIQNGVFETQIKKRFLEKYQEVPDSVVALLHEHIPFLFSTTGTCTYYAEPGNPNSKNIILPGRRLPPNNEFTCGNGEIIKTSNENKSFLTPSLGSLPPHLIVYFGSAEIRFSKNPIFLSTKFLTVKSVGTGTENPNIIVANRTGTSESILCLKGNVKVNVIENIKTDSEYFLGSQDCSLEIVDSAGTTQKVLNPGEAVRGNDFQSIADMKSTSLANDSVDLPSTNSNLPPKTNPVNSKISIQMRPNGNKGDILLFSYTLPMNGPAVCDLKTGASENGPFSNAYQFQAPSKNGNLDLQKGFNSFFLSLECTDGKNKYLSNVLAPKK